MNYYQNYMRPQSRINNLSYSNYHGRKIMADFQSSQFCPINNEYDRFSQTSTNFWTEQKPKSSINMNAPEITLTDVQRIQTNLDKQKFNSETKESASRFDQLNEKINQHLKKIQQFLSKNKEEKTESIKEVNKLEESTQLQSPIDNKTYSYLPIKNKKPQSVNHSSSSLQNHSMHGQQHFTSFSNYLFSDCKHQPLKLKQHLKQLKADLSDRQSIINRLSAATSFWQNVWLSPKAFGKSKTLVLDLDETLIHSSFDPRKRLAISEPKLNCTFEFRPFLKEFLLKCDEQFEIVIFTASEENYANTLVNKIKELCNYRINVKKVLDRKFLSSAGQKDLSILKDRELKDIIFIDNLALSFAKGQLNNGIPILEWSGDARDKELIKIQPFLSHCAKYNDVREPIKERFNLENFLNEPIEWETRDFDAYYKTVFRTQNYL